MMAVTTRLRIVLERDGEGLGFINYKQPESGYGNDDNFPSVEVQLSAQSAGEMGYPPIITVTVEQGDHLNLPEVGDTY
jgi:hypothetical protein